MKKHVQVKLLWLVVGSIGCLCLPLSVSAQLNALQNILQGVGFVADNVRHHYVRVEADRAATLTDLQERLTAALNVVPLNQGVIDDLRRQISRLEGQADKDSGMARKVDEAGLSLAQRAGEIFLERARNEGTQQQTLAIEAVKANAQARVMGDHMAANRAEVTKRLKYGVMGVTASALLLMGAYFGLRHYYSPRPTIIERDDTSIRTFWDRLLKVKRIPPSNLKALVLDEVLEAQVKEKFVGIEHAITRKLPLSNMMFYGPAGTGKTMAAQEFARHLSEIGLADHVIIRGPAFKRFDNPHKAVEMLASILRWAKASSKKNKKPVILIFDEAETLFADREQPEFATKLTSDLVTTMTSFLSSAISNDVMFILSTNFPGRIDKALRNRIAKVNRVRFTVPGQKQREELLKLYLDQNFTELGFTIAPAVFKNLKTYAEKLDHLVGRDIQALTAQPLYTMLSKGKTELTPDLLEAAIAESVKEEDLSAY